MTKSLGRLSQRLGSVYRSLLAAPHPARRLVALILRRTGLCRYFVIQRNGYRVRFYPAKIAVLMWSDPSAYVEEEALLRRLLRPGNVAVDVGANMGGLTLTMADAVGTLGHVIAIEAHPRTFEWLAGNIALNGLDASRVTAINVAAGERSGTISFADSTADDMNRVGGAASAIQVRMATLDDLLADWSHIDVLKVDAEGYEYFVFAGAQETLAKTNAVFFEYSERLYAEYGKSGADVLNLLLAQGFALYREEQSALVPYHPDPSREEFANLLALRAPDAAPL